MLADVHDWHSGNKGFPQTEAGGFVKIAPSESNEEKLFFCDKKRMYRYFYWDSSTFYSNFILSTAGLLIAWTQEQSTLSLWFKIQDLSTNGL